MARRRWSVRLMIPTLIAALVAAVLSPRTGADTTIGPSGMTVVPAGVGGTVTDGTAGTVMKVWSNGGVSIPVATAAPGGRLEIRARGELCRALPIMAVKRGGAVLATLTLGTEWATHTVDLGVQSGPVVLDFVNDYRSLFCDRNLYIAGVAVRDGAPTPTTTPSPTVTPRTTTAPTTAVPTTTVPTTTAAPTGCPVNQFQARYFNNTTATGTPVAVQCENAPGGSFTGSPLAGVNADNFSVDYSGVIVFPQTTTYILSTTVGNVGARVWRDDELVFDRPTPQWGATNVPRTVTAGQHRVRATYVNTSGIAHFGLAFPRATPGAPSNNGNYFAADSFWNQPVPPNATVDPRSTGWISALDASSNGISVNSRDWSTTVYNAPAGTPTADVRITNAGRRLTIPYLSSYGPTQDGDAHLAVIDDATGCLYEFQGFNPWLRTANAAASYRVSTGSGGHVAGPDHAGGEFSYLAGMITPQDVQAGVIDHALRYAMPGSSPNYVYPGTRSDGTVLGGVPQGTRLQLDPSLDLSAFGLTPFQLMVARALQVYGGFNADHSSVFALYARSPRDGTTYAQPVQPLPDALIRHVRFLAPTISSTEIHLDRADDPGCNQQR